MAKNITEYNRQCLEQGSYMLYNLADYEDSDGKFRPTLFNHDLLVENKELIKTIISEVPFYIHETIDDVPQTDEEIEDFLFLPDSRDSYINDVHSKLQENEFWEPWYHDAWGDEANRLLLDIYNKMRWSFITENTYMNAISLLKDDGSDIEFESDEESDAYMKEIIEAKLQNIYSLLNYNMNSSDYLNDWADSLVYSGKLTRQEADREILVYKLQDVRNEVIRRKFAGSSSLYRMLLNSIDRQGTFCGATRVGRVTGKESYSDSRLMRSVYAPWQIPFSSITSENYESNLEELWHKKGGIPYGLFEPMFYTDDGVLRRSQGSNEFSVDEPQGSFEVSKVRKTYTLLRLDQVLNSASNHRHGIVYLNPSEFLTEEAWNSTEIYATEASSSYTLKQLLIQSYGLDANITYADACDTILHKIGEGQYNLGSAVEVIYADAVLDSMVTASIGDGYNVSNMLDITANKVLWHNNSVFKVMGANYPYPIVDGHPISLMDTTWIEHLKRLGEDKMRVSERVLYGAQVGEVLDMTGAPTYFFYWINEDGHLEADEFSTTNDAWVSYTVYGDEVVKTLGANTSSPYYGHSYDDNCALYREDLVPSMDSLPSTLTDDEKEEIRLGVMEDNEEKRNALSRIKLLLAENHITPVRTIAVANGVEEKTLTTTDGEATFSEDGVLKYAEVSEVRGKTVVWNQQFKYTYESAEYGGLTRTYDEENGLLKIKGTTTTSMIQTNYIHSFDSISNSEGKVYYFIGFPKVSDGGYFKFIGLGYAGSFIAIDGELVVKPQYGIGRSSFICDSGTTIDLKLYPRIVDLTTLFGVTEVSQVTEAMKEWVRTYAEAHPQYDGGSLVHAQTEGVKSVGRNLWDEEWKRGYLWNGVDVSTENNIVTVNYIPVEAGKNYYFVTNGATANISWYDGNKVFIGNNTVINGYKPAPSSAKYMRFFMSVDYGNAYKNDLAVVEGTAGSYTPFFTSTLSLSYLSSVPDIGLEGTVVDFGKKTVTWNYGKVRFDGTQPVLGTSFSPSTNNRFVQYRVSALGGDTVNGGEFKVGGYTKFESGMTATESYVSLYHENYPRWLFRNDGFGTTINSVTDWNNYLSQHPVEIVYELATPITKTFAELGIPSVDTVIPVESGGTVSVISTGAQAEATIHYLV